MPTTNVDPVPAPAETVDVACPPDRPMDCSSALPQDSSSRESGPTQIFDLAIVIGVGAFGGSERHTVDYIRYLVDAGWRLVLIESGQNLVSSRLDVVPGRLEVIRTDLPLRGVTPTQARAWKKLLRQIRARSVLVVKTWYYAADLRVLRVLRRAFPVVFHIEHSLPPPLPPPIPSPHFFPRLGLWRYRDLWLRWQMARQVDRVVAVSAAGKRELIRHTLLPRRRVSTCPNGVDASFWNRDEEAGRQFRRLYGIGEEAYLFGVVGRLVPLKCVDLALRALALIPPRPAPAPALCIVGDGPDRGALEQLAVELGIRQRVYFTGSLEDVRGAYSAMGTLLCTSSSESCPLVLSEAMACGCRVLAPPVGGIPELLGHAVCGALVDSRAAADWATEMQGHACTPALERWAIARAVRAYIVGAHDQRMRFADLERLMSQVVPLHD